MAGQRIATTTQAGLHSVGTAGQPVNMAYEQIVRYLTQSLGPDHAHVLAEPNYNPTRGTVDWYTPLDGPVRRLSDLPEDERPQVEGRLAELRDGIAGAAARLGASDHGGDRMLGKMIGLSLEIPGEDHIYIVGDQPVLTCWGMVQDSPAPERGVLRKFIPWGPALGLRGGAVAISRVMMVEPLMWLAWLLWLLFGTLLAVIFIILLSGCGVRVPGFEWLSDSGWANYCPVTRTAEDLNRPDPQLMAERARQSVLEAELSRLELEVAVAVRACRRAEGRPVPAVPIDRRPLPTGPVAVPPATVPPATVPPATVPPATEVPDAPAIEAPEVPAAPVVPAPVDTGEAVDVLDPPTTAAIDGDPNLPVNRSTDPGTVAAVDAPPDADVPHLPVDPPAAEDPVEQADVPHLPVDPPAAEDPVERADVPHLPVDPPAAEEPVEQADVPHLPVDPPAAEEPVEQADVPHLPVSPPEAEEPVEQADVPHLPVSPPEAEEPVERADVPHLPVDPPDEVAAADQAEEPVAEPPAVPAPPEPSLDPAPEPEPPAAEPAQPAPDETADQAPPPSPQEQPSEPQDQAQEPSPEELAANAELAIELDWESEDDLNLHVVCPDGSRIYSLSRQGCGGRLLGDANASGDVEPAASETVAFQEAPDGPLRIEVDNFNARSPGDPPVPFQIRIRRPDGSVEVVEGNVASGDGRVLVREIDVP
ncbi:MAG: hypothetical protein H6843_17050 [Rhodospirillaceae bacterium]|nr:hypothetical protein [Rhodospirillaceae bacterium]